MTSPQPSSAALGRPVLSSNGDSPARASLDVGLPSAAGDDLETRSRSRGAVVIGLLFALVCAIAAVGVGRRDATIAAICAVTSASHVGAAAYAYRTRRYAVPGAFIALSVFIAVALTNLLSREGPSDAFNSLSLLFFVILPQLTMYLVGVRGSIAIGIAAMAYFAAIFAWLLLYPPSVSDPDLAQKYAAASGTMSMGFVMSLVYARTQTRMMSELRAAYTTLDGARVAEQQRLRGEIDLAARIQTALLPRAPRVEGLEIAAAMFPASEVGGDYYDVLPVEGGAWLCIGDVAGHGLDAGLAMLMIQSAVSALAQNHPLPHPARVLSALNTTLYQNVRRRMGRDEHATLTLLRYHRDGTVCFAGAHEEILVLRAAGSRCEAIATPGPWVGAQSSVAPYIRSSELTLADGDILVLYTDGLTEARDGSGQQFGLERVEAEILRVRGEPVEAIFDAILQAVHAFSPVRADDVTLLVARYRAPVVA